jgi:hypothetical protein
MERKGNSFGRSPLIQENFGLNRLILSFFGGVHPKILNFRSADIIKLQLKKSLELVEPLQKVSYTLSSTGSTVDV